MEIQRLILRNGNTEADMRNGETKRQKDRNRETERRTDRNGETENYLN